MTTGKVDLNQATTEELATLPGIGPHLAEKIKEHRETAGPFSAVVDLMAIPGISERMIQALQGMVTVEDRESVSWGSPVIGGHFGPYRIEAHLARGSTGDVYRAAFGDDERPLALKVLSGAFTPDSNVVEDFRWTIEAVAEIDHPGIIHAEEIGVTPDRQLYLVMPYVQGDTLAERLAGIREQRTGLPAVDALKLTRQIVRMLAAAHQAGIVHQMLTPQKIIVSADDGRPRLLGLDRPGALYDLATDGSSNESYRNYLSPEQLQGKILDSRSNLYSVGAMLYELLTGRPWGAFRQSEEGESSAATWEGLSEQTSHIVQTCLREEAWARFQSANKLLLAINKLIVAEISAGDSPAIDAAELSDVEKEIKSLENSDAATVGEKTRDDRRSWLFPVVALTLLLFVLFLVNLGARPSTAIGDDEAELLEGAVGQETLEALMSPQAMQLTPTLSVLGNMLTARALAAPAVPGLGATPTLIPTPTATPTNTPTATPTDTPTPTPTPTFTPTPTATRVPPTPRPSPTPTFTPAPVLEPTDPPAPPPGPQPTATDPPPPPSPTSPPPPTPTPPMPGSG